MKNHCNLFHSKGCTECPEYKTSKSGKGKFFPNFQSVGCNFCATDDQVFQSKKALKEHKVFFHSLKCHSCRVGAVQENLKDLKEFYEEKLLYNKPQENLNNLIGKVQKIQCNMPLGPQVRPRDLPTGATVENQGKQDRKKSKATLIRRGKIAGVTLTDEKIEEMINEGNTDGLFGGNLHGRAQVEKNKLLAQPSPKAPVKPKKMAY